MASPTELAESPTWSRFKFSVRGSSGAVEGVAAERRAASSFRAASQELGGYRENAY